MMIDRKVRILVMMTVLCCEPGLATAQNAPAASSLKAIGAPSFAAAEVAPSLIVINARGATLRAAQDAN